MRKLELECEPRTIQGKKVKLLRQKNITPLNLYGMGQASVSLQCETTRLEKTLAVAGDTGLIDLKVGNRKKVTPVLVREVQRNPYDRKLLHVNLFHVRMDEKVEVEVPIKFVGEAPVLKIKGTGLMHQISALKVQSLPDKIPDHIEVDISSLAEPGEMIHVRDIPGNPDITIMDHPEQVVVVVIHHAAEKAPEAPPPAAEAEAAAPETAAEANKEEEEAG